MGTAGKGAGVVPAPAYREVEGWEGVGDDAPGFRCGHSLTAVAPTKGHGPRLILFGGATAIEAGASSGLPGISSVLPSLARSRQLSFRVSPFRGFAPCVI